MGCGCGGNRGTSRQMRNVVSPSSGVVASANIKAKNTADRILQEKKIVETRRREKLIRALKVP